MKQGRHLTSGDDSKGAVLVVRRRVTSAGHAERCYRVEVSLVGREASRLGRANPVG